MYAHEANLLPLGLYRLHWSEEAGGGSSLAAVGMDEAGRRWMAPANWVGPVCGAEAAKHWHKVAHAEPIRLYGEEPSNG